MSAQIHGKCAKTRRKGGTSVKCAKFTDEQ